MSKKIFILLAFVFLMVSLSFSVDAAGFVKFDGIDGESVDANHDKWIDVLSIDWGAHKPGTSASGRSRRRGGVIVDDFTFTKKVDKSTPKLTQPVCSASAIPKVEIELCIDGSLGQDCYLKYELTNVLISSYEISGETTDVPIEEISLNFEEIKVTYTSTRDGETETAMCMG